MKLKIWSNPKITKESKPIEYEFKPGITMLIGSNGTGKTTTISQINSLFNDGGWSKIESNDILRNKYLCFRYDNEYENKHTKDSWLMKGLVDRIANAFENSEGQNIWNYLYYKTENIGNLIKQAKKENKQGVVLLFDGLDSGLSLDVLQSIKKNLFQFIIKEETNKEFEVYIICSSNSYEFCNNIDCVDVTNQKHITFNNYEEYEKYFIKE